MISEQEDGFDPLPAVRAQTLENLRRARPAIDQIADEYEQCLSSGPVLKLGVDLR
jgi:hypothetical protein